MGQVLLSLEEYEELKKKGDAVAELSKCFRIEKSYSEKEVSLSISITKAAEIFKAMFNGSKYDDGTFEIYEDIRNYNISVADYYIKAVKKKEETEEAETQEEAEQDE